MCNLVSQDSHPEDTILHAINVLVDALVSWPEGKNFFFRLPFIISVPMDQDPYISLNTYESPNNCMTSNLETAVSFI